VVGDAQEAVAQDLGPAPEFGGEEFPVAEKGMGVQVDHEKIVFSFWLLDFGKSRLWFGVIGVSSFWLSESIRNLNYPK
jgi:hypothetical protein